MDGFSYNNIFETNGIEYLIIIAFLVLIIPFWIIINKQNAIKMQVKKALGALSESVLRIPRGLFYSKNHTWTHLERTGNALVGLDDFLLHVTGEIKFKSIKKPNDLIVKGDLIAEIIQNEKTLKITSPISGKIVLNNSRLKYNPGIMNEDPYGKGWIYRIEPNRWIEETSTYYLADEAVAWAKREFVRFKDFLAESMNKYSPETSMLILQDGGELCDRPLSELPDEVWQDFQKSFLN
jgi:glycine cleavage system H protein